MQLETGLDTCLQFCLAGFVRTSYRLDLTLQVQEKGATLHLGRSRPGQGCSGRGGILCGEDGQYASLPPQLAVSAHYQLAVATGVAKQSQR